MSSRFAIDRYGVAAVAPLFAFAALVIAAEAPSRSGKPVTKNEVLELGKRYMQANEEFAKAFAAADSKAERDAALQKRPEPVPEAARFIQWADRSQKDPLASELLVLIVKFGRGSKDAQEAAQLLAREHPGLHGDAFAEAVNEIANWPQPVAEKWLRTYLDKSRNHWTKGMACYALASYKKSLAETARETLDAESIRRMEENFGAGSADYLKNLDSEAQSEEAIKLFRRVGADFSDLEIANPARRALFELMYLSIGKKLPDIEGPDLTGAGMRLGSYRGKVVVVNFWASWCGHCMAMVPHEKALVKRLESEPFALLGVNGDDDLADGLRAVESKGMTWRSWRDDGVGREALSRQWSIRGWPTIFVLDAQGVIRYKNVRNKELDAAVDTLLAELKAPAR